MSDFEYFKPYEGDKPYIFISYAHADDDASCPLSATCIAADITSGMTRALRSAASGRSVLPRTFADAHLVVAFISNAYMRSDNCRREMHYAQSKKIKTINIFIEETALTPGMELQIGNIFAPDEIHVSER